MRAYIFAGDQDFTELVILLKSKGIYCEINTDIDLHKKICSNIGLYPDYPVAKINGIFIYPWVIEELKNPDVDINDLFKPLR